MDSSFLVCQVLSCIFHGSSDISLWCLSLKDVHDCLWVGYKVSKCHVRLQIFYFLNASSFLLFPPNPAPAHSLIASTSCCQGPNSIHCTIILTLIGHLIRRKLAWTHNLRMLCSHVKEHDFKYMCCLYLLRVGTTLEDKQPSTLRPGKDDRSQECC